VWQPIAVTPRDASPRPADVHHCLHHVVRRRHGAGLSADQKAPDDQHGFGIGRARYARRVQHHHREELLPVTARIAGRISAHGWAGDWTILLRLYLPLSKPVLATVALWTAVGHWNAWFDAMLYITDDKGQVLQTFLQRIVIQSSTQMMELGITDTSVVQFTAETIKAAMIIVTILPKYFVKGILLGGVKE